MKTNFVNKFSVGLNLNEDIKTIRQFLNEYNTVLSSIYFSLPLGKKFYSREMLEKEYFDENKFLKAVELIKCMQIRTEVTVNTYGLNNIDLNRIKHYLTKQDIIPDEIVCLEEYAAFFREKFPNIELKYSFNNKLPVDMNDENIMKYFDTMVVGKNYLRDEKKRHEIIRNGKRIVLLINNGCSFECNNGCGTTEYCERIFLHNLQKKDINYYYALQSFFPEELQELMVQDQYGSCYRFKISNRPLGIEYTKKVLDAYMNWDSTKTRVKLLNDTGKLGYFCTMGVLLGKKEKLDVKEILEYKLKFKNKNNK